MDNLRSNVVWGPTERLRGGIVHVLLAHPEVRDLDVPVLVQHDIVQLQVSVDDAQGMKEDDTDCYLSCIKPLNKYCY